MLAALSRRSALASGVRQSHMHSMLIETELTPNPATRKFLPGRVVMHSGSRDFASPEAAEASPLATVLFELGDVTGVHFGRDFIAVTAAPGADWTALQADVAALLLDHFTAGMPILKDTGNGIAVPAETDAADLVVETDPADADIVDQINDLLETRIRPAVANDGGDIRFRGYRDGDVFLTMQGACAGCPSSTATLKHGIESLLKHYVPEVTAVHAV
jgi:Fe-S cluster biogenesis protein NfuA